ncbi:MAG: zinc-ribbon domain-containing protein [Pseudomonadota bacterium]
MSHVPITCPSCMATYRVPAAAMPDGGREVHCSACGYSWFHLWSADADVSEPEVSEQPVASGFDRMDRMRAALRGAAAAGEVSGTETAAPEGFGEMPIPHFKRQARPTVPAVASPPPSATPRAPTPPPFNEPSVFGDSEPELDLPTPPRRRLDPAVAAVLRAEAEVETKARRQEMGLLFERQEELPLQPRPKRSPSEVRARLAMLQDAERRSDLPAGELEPPEPDPVPGTSDATEGFRPLPPMPEPRDAPARRKPDRDRSRIAGAALGSDGRGDRSLPAPLSPRELAAIEEANLRRGFRIGFGVPVLVAVLAVLVVVNAPLIVEQTPDTMVPTVTRWLEEGEQIQTDLAFWVRDTVHRIVGQ